MSEYLLENMEMDELLDECHKILNLHPESKPLYETFNDNKFKNLIFFNAHNLANYAINSFNNNEINNKLQSTIKELKFDPSKYVFFSSSLVLFYKLKIMEIRKQILNSSSIHALNQFAYTYFNNQNQFILDIYNYIINLNPENISFRSAFYNGILNNSEISFLQYEIEQPYNIETLIISAYELANDLLWSNTKSINECKNHLNSVFEKTFNNNIEAFIIFANVLGFFMFESLRKNEHLYQNYLKYSLANALYQYIKEEYSIPYEKHDYLYKQLQIFKNESFFVLPRIKGLSMFQKYRLVITLLFKNDQKNEFEFIGKDNNKGYKIIFLDYLGILPELRKKFSLSKQSFYEFIYKNFWGADLKVSFENIKKAIVQWENFKIKNNISVIDSNPFFSINIADNSRFNFAYQFQNVVKDYEEISSSEIS